jgi:hypothetical protein
VEGAFEARPVVLAEAADAGDHEGDVLAGDRLRRDLHPAFGVARLGQPPEIQHQLDQRFLARLRLDGRAQVRGQHPQEQLQVVRNLLSRHAEDPHRPKATSFWQDRRPPWNLFSPVPVVERGAGPEGGLRR